MHYFKYTSKTIVIALIATLTACSSNQAPVERKEELFYGKSGVVKLVRISRAQSVKELAHNYGVSADIVARANNLSTSATVVVGDVVKIPISQDAQFEERMFNNESDNNQHIDEVSIINHDTLSPDTNVLEQKIDDELAKDLDIASQKDVKNQEVQSIAQIEPIKTEPAARAIPKTEFLHATPLNSKQFIWPIDGKVLSRYGQSGNAFNEGINIAAPLGTVIKAAADGEVLYVGKEPKIYGNLVIIKHSGNYLTAYAHSDKIITTKGAKVKQGQSIATIGKTGAVTTPQLHFSMRKDKKTINPE